jgi:hypothetical protein
VRESCYRFYEPSYMEHSHGCSQEVQSFKRWSEAGRIVRTQSRWCQKEIERKKFGRCTQILTPWWQQPEVLLVSAERWSTQGFARLEQPLVWTQGWRTQEQRTQEQRRA